MLTRIDHVGIAVPSLDDAIALYESTFGLKVVARGTHEDQSVHEAMLVVHDGADSATALGGSYLQLLEPTRPDSPVGKFLAAKGPGVHHIGYGVVDVAAALEDLSSTGFWLLPPPTRHGSLGASIPSLYPKVLAGFLPERAQGPGPPPAPPSLP